MNTLYIVIPAYNEQENIGRCIKDWYPVLSRYGDDSSRLVVVNDGSKDKTGEILKKLQSQYLQLLPLEKPNGGHGSAVLYGYRYAIEQGAEWIFQTDSDGQTNPAEFEAFWNHRTDYDGIIGTRSERGDGKSRKAIEDVVCLILRIIFGVKVADANAPFRLMRSSMAAKYIDKLPADFNVPNIMFTAYFVYYHEKVQFAPITFKPRVKGKNSIDLRRIVKIGWKAVGDFRKLKREMEIRKLRYGIRI